MQMRDQSKKKKIIIMLHIASATLNEKLLWHQGNIILSCVD